MRTMFVLRGAPGAGKSTTIRQHGLQHLSISLDDLRLVFSSPFTDLDGMATLSMANGVEKKVVAAYKEAIENRLRLGATLLIDATNPSRRSYREFAVLAEKCGYEVRVINAQEGLSDDDLVARNETRRGTLGYVAPEVVTAIAARVREGDPSVIERTSRLADIRRLNTLTEIDADAYERVVIIGDVQSCAGALAKAKRHYGGWPERTLVVFVGDLFDRGPDAAGVLDLIGDEPADNIVLVEGNHDEHLRFMVNGVPRSHWADTRASLDQLLASGRSREDLKRLVARFVPALALRFAGRHYLVTHAGLAPATIDRIIIGPDGAPAGGQGDAGPEGLLSYDLTEVPMRQLLMGSSSRDLTYQGRSDYARSVEARLSHPWIIQVHGHRNGRRTEEPGPEEAAPNVYDLEHRVDNGGHLSVLEIEASGRRRVLTFTEDPAPAGIGGPPGGHEAAQAGTANAGPAGDGAPQDAGTLMARMSRHPEIRIRPVEGIEGVVACNFTRRAFTRGAWDEDSGRARGLLLERATSRVVARGYDKFFNIGQPHGPRDLAEVIATGAGRPLTVRRKWNGYLGIVSAVDGVLRVFSKAGVTPYSRHAETILGSQLGRGAQALAALIEAEGVSLTFEIISRRDPHIIDEGPDQAVLLDAIRNQEVFETADDLRIEIARRFALTSPQVEVISPAVGEDDGAALAALRERVRRCEDERAEGLVITYGDGRLTKYKSQYYSEIKAFRTLLERHLAGREVRPGGPGRAWFDRYLAYRERTGQEAPRVEGLHGPVVDIPALIAAL